MGEKRDKIKGSITEEISKNYKKTATVITAAIGETILKSWSIIIFCLKLDLDLQTTIYFLLMSLTPYLSIVVNALFRGETKDMEVENKILTERENSRKERDNLFYTQVRDYNEVCCQLAARDGKVPEAIYYTNNWKESQDKINDLVNGEVTQKVEVKTEVIPEPEPVPKEPEPAPVEEPNPE